MLSKKQKVWLGIFGAMFLVPEILWSPVLNFSYSIWNGRNVPIFLRDNFLVRSDYRTTIIFIVLIQCIGSLGSLILIIKSKSNIVIKLTSSVVVFILFVLSFLVLSLLSATYKMGF